MCEEDRRSLHSGGAAPHQVADRDDVGVVGCVLGGRGAKRRKIPGATRTLCLQNMFSEETPCALLDDGFSTTRGF